MLLVIGLVVGFIVAALVFANLNRKNREETADTLITCLQEQFEYAKRDKGRSGIEQTLSDKGLKYAIYYYGKINNALLWLRPSDKKIVNIQSELQDFLAQALKEDYSNNKNNPNFEKLGVSKFVEALEEKK